MESAFVSALKSACVSAGDAARAIERPDDQHSSRTQYLEAGRQTRVVIASARGQVCVQVLGRHPRRQQCIPLQMKDLTAVCFRDPHVAWL